MSPRKATGIYEERAWKDGRTVSYGCRVRYQGRQVRVPFGTNHEGWNETRARNEMERIVGQIERGTWTPPDAKRAAHVQSAPSIGGEFLPFLYEWWQAKKLELTPRGREDYLWRIGKLTDGELGTLAVSAIDRRAVDAERSRLLEDGLAPRSVNMVLKLLAQVLDAAVDYDLIARNPARGKDVRVKEQPKRRGQLEPDQAIDLIDAAGELEAEARPTDRFGRRAIVAALILAGPRVMELATARRADLDIHGRRLLIGSKTEAGMRTVELTWFLWSELKDWVDSRDLEMQGPLFPTRSGREHTASNIRRLLTKCRDRANKHRADRGAPLIGTVTPHWCRRTFATLCFLQGRDVRFVMSQIGHSDPRMTLSIYAQSLDRRSFDKAVVARLMQFADESFEPLNETIADEAPPARTHRRPENG